MGPILRGYCRKPPGGLYVGHGKELDTPFHFSCAHCPRTRGDAMSATSTSGPAYRTVNPATGEVVQTFDSATDEQIEAALTAVHTAYAAWRDVPIAERAPV